MLRDPGPQDELKKPAAEMTEVPVQLTTHNLGADETTKLGSEKALPHVPNEGPESVPRPVVDEKQQKSDSVAAPAASSKQLSTKSVVQQPTPTSAAAAADDQLQPKFFGADDMPEEMKRVAVEISRVALKKKTNKDRAEHIKKHFDKTYGGTAGSGGKWHCIVGTDFGSYVTHEAANFVFFQLGAYFILIFKA